MDGTAIIFTHGLLLDNAAKTTHGLIRGSERFDIRAIIDTEHAGKDAGTLLDGTKRDIPVHASLSSYLNETPQKPDFFIIGIANSGGKLDTAWFPAIREAIEAGISIVSGMHQFLSDMPEFADLAKKHGVSLIDVRKPKEKSALRFWSGSIFEVTCPVIAVIGTDCAVGKRTTARFLMQACQTQGLNAQMIYTGQTGWMQGGTYGFIFDSTLNDFVSGELEYAVVQCFKETNPDVIFIEGQSALRNPSGPCGSELLISANVDGAILVHPQGRVHYKGWEETGKKIPPLANEIQLIRMYETETLGIALNTKSVSLEEAKTAQTNYQTSLGIPVALPVEEGVEPLMEPILAMIKRKVV